MKTATLSLTRVANAEPLALFPEYQPAPYFRQCAPDGAGGCGQCKPCKAAAKRATARTIDADKPYLGLKTFAQLFPEPRWLKVGHDGRHGYSIGGKFPPPEEM